MRSEKSKEKKQFDVIIVGAGAAGISCALQLHRAGLKILLIEARARVGGRALTQIHSESRLPLELGAEFIHGAPASILEPLENLKVPLYDVDDTHHLLRNKKLILDDHFWRDLQSLINKIPQKLKSKDKSVAEFLETMPKSDPEKKSLFQAFVEGFHAADIETMSAEGLYHSEEASSERNLNGQELFRLDQGYTPFFNRLLTKEDGLIKCLRLQTRLQKISYNQQGVDIICESIAADQTVKYSCQKLVLTLPLSLLKASVQSNSNLQWYPAVPKGLNEILDSMEMGHVQKLILTFKTRFWEKSFKEKPSFWHAGADTYFPTWWTTMPIRSSHLIAWQGGPRAQQMTSWSSAERIGMALKTLSKLLHKPVSFLQNELETYFEHSWGQDPYAQGAYSYIKKDGFEASKKIAKTFEGKFYFAGEATAQGATRGTVHGAWESGQRAATQILKSRQYKVEHMASQIDL